ncbi:hypothetical protein Golax_002747 [Gossypium laxum]|uniref:Uncharacterized protein n=1 Tax=Gossypium laxum TaxID=34288 RepID=A0A7J9AS62_9ROSI|nr:hypothetical protein [Gossypium laxum]
MTSSPKRRPTLSFTLSTFPFAYKKNPILETPFINSKTPFSLPSQNLSAQAIYISDDHTLRNDVGLGSRFRGAGPFRAANARAAVSGSGSP